MLFSRRVVQNTGQAVLSSGLTPETVRFPPSFAGKTNRQYVSPPRSPKRESDGKRIVLRGRPSLLYYALFALTIVMFLPVELSFFVLGLRLTLARTVLLLVAIPIVFSFISKASAGRYNFIYSDLFFALIAVWTIFAPAQIDGWASALDHAGPDALEFCVPYYFVRVALVHEEDAAKYFRFLSITIAVVALFSLLDPITNEYIVHRIARQITGYVGADLNNWDDSHRFSDSCVLAARSNTPFFWVTSPSSGLASQYRSNMRLNLLLS